jgi:hypothetical protein
MQWTKYYSRRSISCPLKLSLSVTYTRWVVFSLYFGFSTNETDLHDLTEIWFYLNWTFTTHIPVKRLMTTMKWFRKRKHVFSFETPSIQYICTRPVPTEKGDCGEWNITTSNQLNKINLSFNQISVRSWRSVSL